MTTATVETIEARTNETAEQFAEVMKRYLLYIAPLSTFNAALLQTVFLPELTKILKQNENEEVIGLYGKIYKNLVEIASQLIKENNISASVVYRYLAPFIIFLQEDLLSTRTVMPLAQFENDMRRLGWVPESPIYTTTG